jgi:hypothetical protein
MHGSNACPVNGKILDYKAAVTVLRGRLAAQEYGRSLEARGIELAFDLATSHKEEKALFVLRPGHVLALLVGVENRLVWRQQRLVFICRPTELVQEEREVSALGEAR